jgi:hypothetical protein
MPQRNDDKKRKLEEPEQDRPTPTRAALDHSFAKARDPGAGWEDLLLDAAEAKQLRAEVSGLRAEVAEVRTETGAMLAVAIDNAHALRSRVVSLETALVDACERLRRLGAHEWADAISRDLLRY